MNISACVCFQLTLSPVQDDIQLKHSGMCDGAHCTDHPSQMQEQTHCHKDFYAAFLFSSVILFFTEENLKTTPKHHSPGMQRLLYIVQSNLEVTQIHNCTVSRVLYIARDHQCGRGV